MALKINDNGVDRNMTAAEKTEYEVWQVKAQAEAQAEIDALEAKATARQTAVNKLGLTADEAVALFG